MFVEQTIKNKTHFLHCFTASLIHLDNHLVEGIGMLSVNAWAFSITPSPTALIEAGASSCINAQSKTKALKPSSLN